MPGQCLIFVVGLSNLTKIRAFRGGCPREGGGLPSPKTISLRQIRQPARKCGTILLSRVRV